MADGFVSYSRDDADLADVLVARLGTLGLDLWVDRVGIAGGARWWEELTAAIVEADTLVVLVTARSMRSRFVAAEIAFAVEQHKPIVPLVRDDVVDPSVLHPILGEYQWIRLGADLDTAVTHAAGAIRQDHVWRRQHAELQRRALEWSSGAGDLLGPAALRRTEAWLRDADGAQRAPTDLQRRFIVESRESGHRSRERERWRVGAAELRAVMRPLVVMLALFFVVSLLPAIATASRAAVGFRRNVVFALDIVPSIFNTIFFLLVIGLFSVWIFVASRNVARAGAAIRPGETVVSFYLPLVGLWRPFRAMRAIRAGSNLTSRRWLFGAWWTAWVIAALGGVIVSQYKWWLVRPITETTFNHRFICSGRLESSDTSECYSGVGTAEAVLTGFDVARATAAVLAIAMVRTVTTSQERLGADETVATRAPLARRAQIGIATTFVLVVIAATLLAAPMNPSPRSDGTEIWCSSVLKTVFTSPQPRRGDVGTEDGIVPVVSDPIECHDEAFGRFAWASLLIVAAVVVVWRITRRRQSWAPPDEASRARAPPTG